MTAKEYLSQAKWLGQRIAAREAERDRILALVAGARSPQLTGMPRGGQHDWTDAVDRAVDMTAGITQEIRELMRLKSEINAVIAAVPDERYRTLLEMRYRSYYTWEKIAVEMGYEIRQVFRLHGEALLKVHVPAA